MTDDRSRRSRSFGQIAADYHRYRPRTPVAVLDWLVPSDAVTILDVAAGTGILSESLVPRVRHVVAVEPDAAMRTVLAREVPGAAAVAGTAEALPLRGGAVDAALVSSAWHWFDAERAASEIARVLAPGGRLGLVGSTFDPDVDWVLAMRRSITGAAAGQRPSAARPTLPDGAPFGAPDTHEMRWSWRLTRQQLLGLLGTYSRVIVASTDDRAAMRAEALRALDSQPANRGREVVEVPMRTWATRFTRCP